MRREGEGEWKREIVEERKNEGDGKTREVEGGSKG